MEASFWHNKWENNQLGWHESEVNADLINYLPQLALTTGSTVFVPLCGKTKDIGYLLAIGHKVIGAELSELAVKQLFADLSLQPTTHQHNDLICYCAGDLTVWVGDIFHLHSNDIGSIDACYDRAALIALPSLQRQRYSEHLRQLLNGAAQLLITVEYDQTTLAPPPFALTETDVRNYYDDHYRISLMHQSTIEGGLKGKVPAQQLCWLLHRN